MAQFMKVVILAGGFGTRISEESHLRPKPMIEIGGKPILWHIMKIYSHYGFNDFIICAGYKQDYIKDYFYNYYMYGYAIVQVSLGLLAYVLTLIADGLLYWGTGLAVVLLSFGLSLHVLRRKTHLWQALTRRFRRG